MLILLPGAVLGLLWYLLTRHRGMVGLTRLSRRGTLVIAYLGFETLLELVTQLTSIGHHFTRGTVVGSWCLLVVVLAIPAWPDAVRAARNLPVHPHLWSRLRAQLGRLGWENLAWLGIVALILGILGYLGWSFLPSNGDSLVYHLTRVEHWIQDGTVGPFPTHYLAQVELSPLSEHNLGHLHLLLGSDRLDALMQYTACLICLVAVSEVARLLKGSTSVQVVAVVICVTIPSGILLATSTENDYFAAAIGISLIVLVLGWPDAGTPWFPALMLGFGIGIGYLAKGTIPALLGPTVGLLLLWRMRIDLRRTGAKKAAGRWVLILAGAAVVAAALAAPFASQNISLFGSVAGPVSKGTLSSGLTAQAATANIIRSTASDFMMGNGTSGPETATSSFVLDRLHSLFDTLHVHPGDQRYALGTITDAFQKRDYRSWQRSPDVGADPWDVVLIAVACLLAVIALARGDRKMRLVLLVAGGLVLGFLLFSGTARWSIFVVRYQLPLFVAWSPVIALALATIPKLAVRIILCLLVVACLPQLFTSTEEPFLHPSYAASSLDPYFLDTNVKQYITASGIEYVTVAAIIAQSTCSRVGLANWVLVEYPLWVGVKNAGWDGTIQDVMVDNVTNRLSDPHYDPCILVHQAIRPYVGAESGKVQLQFGTLALSLDPETARTVRVPIPGFTSTVPGVRLLPGDGWAQGGTSAKPTLVGSGSVYLFSPYRTTVDLRLRSSSPTWAAHAIVTLPGPGGAVPVTTGPSVPVTIGPGATEVRIDAVGATSPSTPTVAGVDVLPAT